MGLGMGESLLCTNCQAPIAKYQRYCPACGQHFTWKVPEGEEAPKCPNCNTHLDVYQEFCSVCGNKISWGASYAAQPSSTQPIVPAPGHKVVSPPVAAPQTQTAQTPSPPPHRDPLLVRFIKKFPGFRKGVWWHMLLAIVGYPLILLLILAGLFLGGLGIIDYIDQSAYRQTDEPTAIKSLIITRSGEGLDCVLSLVHNQTPVVADGKVKFEICDSDGKICYNKSWSVESSEFSTYQFILTGGKFPGYAWRVDFSDMEANRTGTYGEAIVYFYYEEKILKEKYETVPLFFDI